MTNHLNHIQNLLSRFHAFENLPPNPMQFRPTLMGRITSSRNSEIMRFSILLKLFHLLASSQQFLLHRNTITKNYHCLLHHPLNVGIHQSASVVRCPLSVVRCPLSVVPCPSAAVKHAETETENGTGTGAGAGDWVWRRDDGPSIALRP